MFVLKCNFDACVFVIVDVMSEFFGVERKNRPLSVIFLQAGITELGQSK